jgi:hypothetical protein
MRCPEQLVAPDVEPDQGDDRVAGVHDPDHCSDVGRPEIGLARHELFVGVDGSLRPLHLRKTLGPQHFLAHVDGSEADRGRPGKPHRADFGRCLHRIGHIVPEEYARSRQGEPPHKLSSIPRPRSLPIHGTLPCRLGTMAS